MKVLVLNAQRAAGISKTGNQYDICTVTYAVPVQQVSRENRKVVGYGFNAQEVGLDPGSMGQFAAYEYPLELNLIIEPDPQNLNRNMCKGVAK
mgnify:CR=1 FL=1